MLRKDFNEGFAILYIGPKIQVLAKKLRSALICPQVVRDKTEKNFWHLGRILGPFDNALLEHMRVSLLGIVLKKAPGNFKLIHHLSHPEGESVNDYIGSSEFGSMCIFPNQPSVSSSTSKTALAARTKSMPFDLPCSVILVTVISFQNPLAKLLECPSLCCF